MLVTSDVFDGWMSFFGTGSNTIMLRKVTNPSCIVLCTRFSWFRLVPSIHDNAIHEDGVGKPAA